MCGICGYVGARADTAHEGLTAALEAMNAAMAHRGPDDAGLWAGENAGLAMRRLSIIDVEGGRQPIANEDGSVVVVFNGEIYNHRPLRAELEQRGHRFATRSDTEVIVHAYEEYGDAAFERFNGMFAAALYDKRRARLLLARDRLGIKPLFYAEREGALAFASELGALRASGLVRNRVNPAALDAYFALLYIPAPDTIYEDAHKLMPGEMLVFEQGRARKSRYWRPRFEPDSRWTVDEAAERWLELLRDSVRLRMISDVPLGAFLSGGLDSSSVTALLAEASAAPVKTFSIGFDDAHADELRYARIAAQHCGADHHEAILRPDMTETAGRLGRHFGEPFADSSAAPTWLVSKTAREHVTVALSGDGGDELGAGYTWLHRTRSVAAYRRVPQPLRTLVDAALRCAPETPMAAKLRRFSADSFLPHREAFRRRQTCFTAEQRAGLYAPAWADAVAGAAADRFAEHADAGAGLSPDDWMLHQDTSLYLPDDILTKVDRMSMAASLEARVPLLDHRLVEFAATLPFALKLRGGVSKRFMKQAVRGLLPPALLRQRKRGFAIPIQRWFRGELRVHFEETVLRADARCRDYLETKAIRALFEAHQSRRADAGHYLWALLMFEHWLEDGLEKH